MKIVVLVADESHIRYTDEICEEILISARERGTGIARRTPEYLTEKILAGKAVIAVSEDGRFAGFTSQMIEYNDDIVLMEIPGENAKEIKVFLWQGEGSLAPLSVPDKKTIE